MAVRKHIFPFCLLWFASWCAFAHGQYQKVGPVQFVHEFQVHFADEEKFPIHFVITPSNRADPQRFLIESNEPQRISCQLSPGYYRAMCETKPGSGYFNSTPVGFLIDRAGKFSGGNRLPARFLLIKEIDILVPGETGTMGGDGALLSWKPIPGASLYKLDVLQFPGPLRRSPPTKRYESNKPIFTFPKPLEEGSRYQIQLSAFHAEGEQVGFLDSWTFFTDDGAKAEFEKLNGPGEFGFLGVKFSATSPFGAAVLEVLPGTTAERAGLRQSDVITKFGDHEMADISSNGFGYLCRTTKPGTTVEFEILRYNEKLTLEIEIMERPQEYR